MLHCKQGTSFDNWEISCSHHIMFSGKEGERRGWSRSLGCYQKPPWPGISFPFHPLFFPLSQPSASTLLRLPACHSHTHCCTLLWMSKLWVTSLNFPCYMLVVCIHPVFKLLMHINAGINENFHLCSHFVQWLQLQDIGDRGSGSLLHYTPLIILPQGFADAIRYQALLKNRVLSISSQWRLFF